MRPFTIAVSLVAAALAALVVRVAFVEAYAGKSPATAAAVWSGHPSVELTSGLAQIGNAARDGRPVERPLIDGLIHSATRAPLAPEPFLVRGVDAGLRGDTVLAGRALIAARDRDPRSIPARYFLADHFLKTGQSSRGLNEISALTRLVPGTLAGVGPYLAAYARDPEVAGQVQTMLRSNPELEPVVLNALASDARDANLALSLWSGGTADRLQVWQNRLLESLIAAGLFREAHSAWMRFTKQKAHDLKPGELDFAATSQGPFGWTLASSSSGVAEAETSKKLRVIYYGRDDIVLASRVLMLQPGRYRMSMRINGGSASTNSLVWTIECLPSGKEVGRSSVAGDDTGGTIGSSLEIAADACEAQRIRLTATSEDLPEKVELTIADFRIEREGGL